jgi:hypothetical protein
MSQPGIKRVMRTIAAAAALGAVLAGCSDPGLYLDRRDTIALSGGDAVAANAAEQMVNPWPRASDNTNIAFNGQKMQTAIERYRTNKVTDPVDPMMLQVASSPASQTNVSVNSGGGAPAGGAPSQ